MTHPKIEQVRDNNKEYFDAVLFFAKSWSQKQFKAVSSDDLKKDYYAIGNEPPREPRVFGSIFAELSRRGLIFKKDFITSKDPICNGRPKQRWISRAYKLQQQSNRANVDRGFNLFSA